MFIWCKSSAHRVFPSAKPGREDLPVLKLECGRNMHASGQIILRDFADFSIGSVEVAGDVPGEWVTFYRQEYVTYNDGMPYPDRLSPGIKCEVKAHFAQSIWFSVSVPADAVAGSYACDVIIHTSAGDLSANVKLRVYDVLLPDAKDGSYDHEYFFTYTEMRQFGSDIPMYSEKWWGIMKEYANAMKELRVNHLSIWSHPLLQGEGTRRTGKYSWEFCFDRFDAFVEHFFRHGSFRRIVLAGITSPITAKNCASFDEKGGWLDLETRSEEGEAYLRSYFSAIHKHFTEKGWYDITATHLSDEPHESENWLWLRGLLAEVCPGMPVTEPMDTYEPVLDMAEACDEFIPRLEVYEQGKDFFDKRVKAGKKLWCYSCCYPEQHWFLNKFIDLPHHYSRLIHWACYSNNITGFLHWGFNYWNTELYGLFPNARFKGDGFIVYPDAENGTVLLSNRALATREGIEEYELMRILSEKYPAEVKAIAAKAAVSFHEFTEDSDLLDSARTMLFSLV